MKQLLLVAVMLAMLAFGLQNAGAQQEDWPTVWESYETVSLMQYLNNMPDDQRFALYDAGELPPAPVGYKYVEDGTLVVESF